MFTTSIDAGGILKGLFGLIESVREEATFVATPKGLGFVGMDASHVALIIVEWNKSDFASFKCDEKNLKFSVRTDEIAKIFKKVGASDNVTLTVNDNSVLEILINEKLHYKIRLIEDVGDESSVPKVDFTQKFTITNKEFVSCLENIGIISEYLNIKTGKDSLIFAGDGDTGECKIEIDTSELESFEVENDSEATYSLEYLKNMTSHIGPISNVLGIEYAESKPLLLKVPIGKKSGIQMYLAPRIET